MKTLTATGLALWISIMSALAFGADAPKGPKMTVVATCNDGKVFSSVSGDHRGACSGHGGVASWASGEPVKSHGKKTSYK